MACEEAIGSVAGLCFVGGVKGHDECMRVGIPTADSSVIRCGIYFRPVAFAAVKSSNVCTVRLVFKHTVSCLVCAVIHIPQTHISFLISRQDNQFVSVGVHENSSNSRWTHVYNIIFGDGHLAQSGVVILHLAGNSMFARFGIELCYVIEQFAVMTPIAERNRTLVYPPQNSVLGTFFLSMVLGTLSLITSVSLLGIMSLIPKRYQ